MLLEQAELHLCEIKEHLLFILEQQPRVVYDERHLHNDLLGRLLILRIPTRSSSNGSKHLLFIFGLLDPLLVDLLLSLDFSLDGPDGSLHLLLVILCADDEVLECKLHDGIFDLLLVFKSMPFHKLDDFLFKQGAIGKNRNENLP